MKELVEEIVKQEAVSQLLKDVRTGKYNNNLFETSIRCKECVFNINNKICIRYTEKIKENQVGCYGGYKWKK